MMSVESSSSIEEDALSSDIQSMSDGEGEEEIEREPTRSKALPRSRVIRFSAAQRAYLNTYYQNGMTSVAKRYSLLISQAAKETKLSTSQIKVHC